MKIKKLIENGLLSYALLLLTFGPSAMAQEHLLVRFAAIEVDTAQLPRYNYFLREEIDASIRKESGVITLYAVAESLHQEKIMLFETYADSSQYRAHLATPHFQKYKQGTMQMVKHLELIEAQPILYVRKPALSKASVKNLFVRVIKMEIDSSQVDNFKKLAQEVMLPGIKKELGVLVMYAVSEKKNPTRVSVLEVYADANSYQTHLNTQHFLQYKAASKGMVKSLKMIDVELILLGSKPQK